MHFTNPTTATAVAIVAMAVSHSALIRVAAAPVTLSQADYLRNGQDAQKLNAQFEAITAQDPCNDGETGCVAGDFATCSPKNAWEVSPCPTGLKCYAVPLVDKIGTTVSCTTQDDALARIEDTVATGGMYGNGSSDDNNNNGNNNGTKDEYEDAGTSAVVTGTSTALPTDTSAPAASYIPEINIPVGDNLSDVLSTITTDAPAVTSNLTGETTSSPTATTASTTCSTPTNTPAALPYVTNTPNPSDIPAFDLPVGDNLTDVLATLTTPGTPAATSSASTSTGTARRTIDVTTTVAVAPSDTEPCVTETSVAQGTETTSKEIKFTTHPFSPIPVSTSTSASGYATSTSAGYTTASTSSPEAPLNTTSAADSVSYITQTAPLSFPIGGTIFTIPENPTEAAPTEAAPTEAAPYATSSAPAYSSEPSVPPKEPGTGPDVIVLPPSVITLSA